MKTYADKHFLTAKKKKHNTERNCEADLGQPRMLKQATHPTSVQRAGLKPHIFWGTDTHLNHLTSEGAHLQVQLQNRSHAANKDPIQYCTSVQPAQEIPPGRCPLSPLLDLTHVPEAGGEAHFFLMALARALLPTHTRKAQPS